MNLSRSHALATLLLLCAASSALAQAPVWVSNGPSLFQVGAVATGSDELVVYASGGDHDANQSAVFQSVNAGQSWTVETEAAQGEFFGDILVDPTSPQTIYAASLGTATNVNLYRTNDGGATWPLTGTIPDYCSPSFSPTASAGTVLVSCGARLYRTNDTGATWTQVTTPFTEAVRLTPGSAGAVLAYGPTKIFKTTSDGNSWIEAGNAPSTCPGFNALRVDPTNPNVYVAGTGLTGPGGFQCGGIFRSTNAGASWSATTLSAIYVTDVVFDETNPARVYASGSYLAGILPKAGAYASFDGGATWTNLQLPTFGASRLALSASGTILYAATPLGVYTLPDTGGTPMCTQDDLTLCLDGGRFRVTASWTSNDNSSGLGHAVPLTGDTGYFWFFDRTNIEVVVKVLEACSVNGNRWVFASGLTNVFVNLSVTDITGGATNTYRNPQGTAFQPIQDTAAFPCN
jgi:photosystem II stability/assembly factor-like uncharacterized protein